MSHSDYVLAIVCIFLLAALLALLLVRGADERRPLPEPEPPNPSIKRAAQLALEHYHAEMRAGGEPHYPHWAEDTLRGKQ